MPVLFVLESINHSNRRFHVDPTNICLVIMHYYISTCGWVPSSACVGMHPTAPRNTAWLCYA